MIFRNLLLALLLLPSFSQAQDKTALHYASQLDSTYMKANMTQLTSEEFEGRKTNTEGSQLTKKYLTDRLNDFKIQKINGSYKQNIEASIRKGAKKYFRLNDFNYTSSYEYYNRAYNDSVIAGEEIVFAGYGVYDPAYNDFAKIDIEDKMVMLLKGEGPVNKFGVPCHKGSNIPNFDYIYSQNPRAILMVEDGFNSYRTYSSERLFFYSEPGNEPVPTVKINELLANRILEPIDKTTKQLKYEIENNCYSTPMEFKSKVVFNGNYTYTLSDVNNVVGFIEGTDLKDEYIVLSAHYDHIGKNYRGKIYPGADDNASGVCAVLEIARVLNKAKKAGNGPRRSVIILLTAAEEEGLHGSKYYVQKPLFPLESTIACINIDMLGRIGANISNEDKNQGYVYALTGTREINDSLFGITDSLNNLTTRLSVLPSEGSYSRFFSLSDHYNFYQEGVPSMMFTNGIHADLHKSTDTMDKIEFDALLERTKLVFMSIWELANNPEPFR